MSDFKAKMHQIRFRLGLRPRPRWGSLQRSPRPLSWYLRGLLLWEGKGKKGRERREGIRRGERKGGKEGEGRRGREGGEGRRGRGEGRKGKGGDPGCAPQLRNPGYDTGLDSRETPFARIARARSASTLKIIMSYKL